MRFRGAGFSVALLLTLAGCVLTGCDRGTLPEHIGKPAPQFVVTDSTRTVDLAKLRGHVVLVNFWASWCAPCVDELPSLLALQQELPGLDIVAISIDDDASAYRAFLTRNHVDLMTVRDPAGRVSALYGTVQIPETYAVDRNGILRRKFVSAQNWTSPEIVDYLKRLGA